MIRTLALLSVRASAPCESDESRYPDTKFRCCFVLEPMEPWQDVIQLSLAADFATVTSAQQNGWRVTEYEGGIIEDDEEFKKFEFCGRWQRDLPGLRMQLQLPMLMVAVLLLTSPLFGDYQRQINLKLFTLLLGYLFKFYEFTLCLNLISILCSLAIDNVSKRQHSLPPPVKLTSLANLVNKFLCICLPADNEKEEQLSDLNAAAAAAKYSVEWTECWLAVHKAIMGVLTGVYLVGCAVILL